MEYEDEKIAELKKERRVILDCERDKVNDIVDQVCSSLFSAKYRLCMQHQHWQGSFCKMLGQRFLVHVQCSKNHQLNYPQPQ